MREGFFFDLVEVPHVRTKYSSRYNILGRTGLPAPRWVASEKAPSMSVYASALRVIVASGSELWSDPGLMQKTISQPEAAQLEQFNVRLTCTF